MTELKKLADALEICAYGERSGAHRDTCVEAAALLRAAAGADVAQIMKLIDEFAQTSAHCLLNIRPKTDLAVQRAALESALRLLVAQVPRWRPISEAPKDGTEVILGAIAQTYESDPVPPRVTIGSWLEEVEELGSEFHSTGSYLGQYPTGNVSPAGWMSWDGGFTEENPPTHYMPKPPPPAPKETA